MPSFVRFRKQSHPPERKRNATAVYADADGVLKQLSSEGDVSDLAGGGGGGSQPPETLQGTDASTVPLTVLGADGQSNDIFLALTDLDNFLGLEVDQHGGVHIETADGVTPLSLHADGNSGVVLQIGANETGTILSISANGAVSQRVPDGVDASMANSDGDFLFRVGTDPGGLQAQHFTISETGAINMNTLPTSDPHVLGQLWNNAGTLKISAGP